MLVIVILGDIPDHLLTPLVTVSSLVISSEKPPEGGWGVLHDRLGSPPAGDSRPLSGLNEAAEALKAHVRRVHT